MKSLSALFWGITSNNNGDFYYLNCFQLSITENTLKNHEKVCIDHDYCYVEIPNADNKILTLFRMGFFGAAHGWWGAKKTPSL